MSNTKKYATIHLVDFGEKKSDGEYLTVSDITNLIKKHHPELVMRFTRGDIINNVGAGQYRSEGSYMVSSVDHDSQQFQLIDREFEYDDYGSPASCFKGITEFPLDYWDEENMTLNEDFVDENDLNEFYWHSSEEVPVVVDLAALGLSDLKMSDLKLIVGKDKYHYYCFTANTQKYLLLIDSHCINNNEGPDSIIFGEDSILHAQNGETCLNKFYCDEENCPQQLKEVLQETGVSKENIVTLPC